MLKTNSIRNCHFAFKCNAKWDELVHTQDDDIRFCSGCEREVYFCHSDDELAEAIRLNRCIAIQQYSDSEPLLGEPI